MTRLSGPEAPAIAPRRAGVRAYLFAIIAASAAVPVALSGGFHARRLAEADAATSDRLTLAVAGSLSKQLAEEMLGHVRSSEVLAAQVQMSGISDPQRLLAALQAHARSHPEITGALVLDRTGKSIGGADSAAVRVGPLGLNYADRDYYLRVRATQRAVVSPRVSVGRVTAVLNLHVAAPVVDRTGTLLAIVVSSVDVGPIAAEANAVASGLGNDGRVVVVDAEGHLIADSEAIGREAGLWPRERRAGDPGAGGGAWAAFESKLRDVSAYAVFRAQPNGRGLQHGHDDYGRSVRAGVVPIDFEGLGWRVVALRTAASIQHQSAIVRFETVLFTAATLVAAIGIAALLAAWLARPVRVLAEHAARVGAGDVGSVPEVVRGGPREIATLTNAVRAMIERLRLHSDNLEQLVALRTTELTRVNDQLGHALSALQEKERVIVDDLAQAKLFQEKILPALPATGALEWSVHYQPLAEVGGDIFDIHPLEPGRFRVFLADAIGHGVQASMRTIIIKAEYDRVKTAHAGPAAVLSALNRRLIALLPGGEAMCTASCFDLWARPGGAAMVYANAGQNPILRFAGGPPVEVYAHSIFLGLANATLTESPVIEIESGEILIASTDGLIEQQNGSGIQFEEQVMGFALPQVATAGEAVTTLIEAMHAFRGQRPLSDDITLIAIKVLPSDAAPSGGTSPSDDDTFSPRTS